jgi:molybdopterin synthase sulfur carrier subunit
MIRVLYFARVREQLASPGEDLPADPSLATAADLIERLRARGATWEEVFGPDQRVLVAINQELARPETSIADGDEVAFFPPVTGG